MGAPLADVDIVTAAIALPPFDQDSPERLQLETIVGLVSDLARGEAKQYTWTLETVPPEVAATVLLVSVKLAANIDQKTSITTEEITRRWEKGDLFSSSQVNQLRSCRPYSSGGLSTIEYSPSHRIQSPHVTPVQGQSGMRLYDGRGY